MGRNLISDIEALPALQVMVKPIPNSINQLIAAETPGFGVSTSNRISNNTYFEMKNASEQSYYEK